MKGYDNSFNSWIDKKNHFMIFVIAKNKIVIVETKKKVEWDLSNYATKSDVEKVKGVDTSVFAKKSLFS